MRAGISAIDANGNRRTVRRRAETNAAVRARRVDAWASIT